MKTLDQQRALAETELAADERADFWREPRHDDIECLSARFTRHRYVPHTHETYVVGTVVAGVETYVVRGARRYASAGSLCLVNAGEVHDGEPYGGGYVYRMVYPSTSLLRQVAAEVTGREGKATPFFRDPVANDAVAAAAFVEAHRALASGQTLEGDERLLSVLGLILVRHADIGAPARLGRERRPIERARDYLEAHFADDVDLATLARVAGLSRFHLIRAFRGATGLTPHAWLADRRVRAARRMLGDGRSPADVALLCGFTDQSHLTRAFKARIGATPARFRSAVLAATPRHAS